MEERLQKVMSNCGVASRRASEKMILEGRVRVNGVIVRELGTKVDPDKDRIAVDGKTLEAQPKHYYLFNKPKGVITTSSDDQGRATVMDYFRKEKDRIYAVGRLDQNTEGLLIMTNDGELANILMHPSRLVDIGYDPKTNLTSVEITIHEGRNRQVRRMFEFFGYQVHNLRRVQYAFLTLSGVKRGAYRKLTREEVAELYKYK